MAQRLDLVAEGKTVPLWRLEVAGSWLSRLRGLIGRRGLGPGEGLYLPGTNSIHMLFMRFAIDVVFVGAPRTDGSRQVVAVHERLAPWTGVVWWVRGARGAVELPAGALARAGLSVGDLVRLERAD
jgi:uncharacterized membrane protein (UPF0127 family)